MRTKILPIQSIGRCDNCLKNTKINHIQYSNLIQSQICDKCLNKEVL